MTPDDLSAFVRDVPDYPTPGVLFKDITPLLGDGPAFRSAIDGLADLVDDHGMTVDRVVAVEARGFIIGAPLALRLGVGFTPVRKPGKLPWQTTAEEYALEYGTDRVEVHTDGMGPGERVLIVDDVIATGGTAAATGNLVERVGAEVVGYAFLLELGFLGGRAALGDRPILTLLSY